MNQLFGMKKNKNMKRFSILSALFVAAIAITGCRLEEPEFITTDKGPSQTVTLPSMALMGSQMDFSVALNDEIALSTLKIKVLFDETVVADTTIRTKTNGTYEGHLMIPFLKDIPDGTATVKVTSQNIQFGLDALCDVMSDTDGVIDSLKVAVDDYRELFRTDGERKKALRNISEAAAEMREGCLMRNA